ncbi:H-2 class I histocompatibility antigen, D-D alpha chain-like isoform X1 [Phyllopteryx taeniolatus]|uniref:H-2 class I histocompatibility antigen, D-D alpha chain-like isoform X1 n=1 Tax=Phyllopteryx taeniolatus TaxID=161469 RepID=UPI002AD487D7|nr:H-2 class I histocompatibility antigen, D-D alpha chain-like isoform X1 [Phyllopteryx taeniolatus]
MARSRDLTKSARVLPTRKNESVAVSAQASKNTRAAPRLQFRTLDFICATQQRHASQILSPNDEENESDVLGTGREGASSGLLSFPVRPSRRRRRRRFVDEKEQNMAKLNLCVLFVAAAQIHSVTPVLHTLKYFTTASSQIPNIPDYSVVGYVDDIPISRYDSKSRKAKPKQDWMNKITADDPHYWEGQTEMNIANEQNDKGNIETVKERFNQTGGVHMVQVIFGCEWDDETDEVDGWLHLSYDGEVFISLEVKTMRWIAAHPQAFVTKLKWDRDEILNLNNKHYYTEICPSYLKKHVTNGRDFLMRTAIFHPLTHSLNLLSFSHRHRPFSPLTYSAIFVPLTHSPHLFLLSHTLSLRLCPSLTWCPRLPRPAELPTVSLLQKTPSSPVTCHATGFYPIVAALFWRKDGEELHEDVETGETLRNHDGTFQMTADLKAEVTDEAEGRYECVFQLSGVEDDIVVKLERRSIRSNARIREEETRKMALAVAVPLAVLALAAVAVLVKLSESRRAKYDPASVVADSEPASEPAARFRVSEHERDVSIERFLITLGSENRDGICSSRRQFVQ